MPERQPATRRALREVRLQCSEATADIVAAQLWSLGMIGCETGQRIDRSGRVSTEIRAFFEDGKGLEALLSARVHAEADVGPIRLVEDRDWLQHFREHAQPIEVGSRFVVDPGPVRDTRIAARSTAQRTTLSIPAEQAFGTGSHESTQLTVEWLEELELDGLSVLDVGTGSGILIIVSLHLGAGQCVGFDFDQQAVIIAAANIRRNVERTTTMPLLYAGRLAALQPPPNGFEVVVANVLPQRIRAELGLLRGALALDGTLICSGHLASDRQRSERDFASVGLAVVDTKTAGEWIAYRLQVDG